MSTHPEVLLTAAEARAIEVFREEMADLRGVEASAPTSRVRARLADALLDMRRQVLAAWPERHYVIVRGLPRFNDGSTALIVAMGCFASPKSYRGDQIVKHFRMSPWTTALSHTLASGSFHTDINTADVPPAATIMQCIEPDPGAPEYGQLRVVPARDLRDSLMARGFLRTMTFLEDETVTMVNETAPDGWRGRILNEGTIRFHPESLRAAQRRFASNPPDMEEQLSVIHEVATSISVPVDLAAGDVLMVSNRRALHQRGACTVRFRSFPLDYVARRVAVAHMLDEPQ